MTGVAVLAVAAACYALLAGRLDRWSIGGPLVFVALGAALCPSFAGVITIHAQSEPVRVFTELTLAILLFADASTVDLRRVEYDARLPGRLLFIGLPLTIGLGTLIARGVLQHVDWPLAALVAAILAPTDLALSLPVVTDPMVPVRVRRLINVESGLNDGICAPFVTFFLALTVAVEESQGHHLIQEAVKEIAVGVLVACLVGLVGGWLVMRARRHGWTTEASEQLLVLSLALAAYFVALAWHGNGFVSAFVAGLVFGAATKGALHAPTEFADRTGLFMSLLVWAIFGSVFAGPVLALGLHPRPILFALLSLTVIRMLPVAISLVGSGLRRDTVAFVGWFGPRGLASVVFTLLAYDGLREATLPTAPLVEVAVWTILLSVILHGLTGRPFSKAYGLRISSARPEPLEARSAPEPRVRRRTVGPGSGTDQVTRESE
jgi:NhaP-type Na+/H+ or K+/H+ antiporter